MQKRSHKLLASALLRSRQGFNARRFELAFLFGSFQPDCNPLTYFRGFFSTRKLQGHNFSNSQAYINRKIRVLQHRARWTMWQYYTLGKLTHYLADAFTYPHNETFSDSLMDHHRYETDLRQYLEGYLSQRKLELETVHRDLTDAIADLHRQYLSDEAGEPGLDAGYITAATALLVSGCRPAA